ncbi:MULTISPECIES: sigma-54-dependent Fis family transcriptional regulator [unclassified Thioalkalivibrio]|uniref:sigma-54-dependent Fis family transcriptional regulator n=1 Tax=unclassified Thioalkalivibrio TaxID=2621013 RepID=UPI0003620ED3|nr:MULTISPECIES: sigma-54-dependent Fis family transcriptional regulator [unclassified Thioalkalivibrio]
MSRATILLVDAQPALREAVVRVLATIPRVRLESCQSDAFAAALETHRPRVVLVASGDAQGDWNALGEQVPVAAVGSDAAHEDEIRAFRQGLAAHFALPSMADAMGEWLRTIVKPSPGIVIPRMVAQSVSMQLLDAFVSRIAASPATVFVTGESGVGKEVLARQVHARSPRAHGPFEAVNCAALPETMLEALLFGHAKGAFTGALEARAGKFAQAHGGTLLLDEVTEIPVNLQAKLLRVLQEREVEPLGGRQARRVDVRVIATSNRDLREALAEGVLRDDLYYRLNVFPVWIPPLRERPEDIVPLARALLRRLSSNVLTDLDASAQKRLVEHDWPGNVRELANVMERAVTLHDTERGSVIGGEAIWLDLDMLMPWGTHERQALDATDQDSSDLVDENSTPMLEQTLQTQESRVILNVLRESGGRRKEAAERLGISPRTLRYKIARLRESGFAVPSAGN